MPIHHEKHHDRKHAPGKGPKEREIAATLTASAVTLAANGGAYPTLESAADAVAAVYARMFELVAAHEVQRDE